MQGIFSVLCFFVVINVNHASLWNTCSNIQAMTGLNNEDLDDSDWFEASTLSVKNANCSRFNLQFDGNKLDMDISFIK